MNHCTQILGYTQRRATTRHYTPSQQYLAWDNSPVHCDCERRRAQREEQEARVSVKEVRAPQSLPPVSSRSLGRMYWKVLLSGSMGVDVVDEMQARAGLLVRDQLLPYFNCFSTSHRQATLVFCVETRS